MSKDQMLLFKTKNGEKISLFGQSKIYSNDQIAAILFCSFDQMTWNFQETTNLKDVWLFRWNFPSMSFEIYQDCLPYLTHYQTTNFRLFQTERVCRRHFQILRKWQTAIQTGSKHCGKTRNCSLRAISPFPTLFSKDLFPRGIKRCHCVGMG